ncbi:MAG TPA: BACON domain-containing carbohydrate-binding protein, partial [Candidatus Cybelea sp.]|nr:BACON domain-containing carbohydrate-binding protein [Candidatus Cybelea sp.]
FGNVIKEWIASNSTVTTLVSSGLDHPVGVALDRSGNLYIADSLAGEIEKWTATDSNVTPVVSAGVPTGVAVDSAGNLYIANFDNTSDAVLEWTLANGSLTALVSSNSYNPFDLAVDGAGNVYFSDPFQNVVLEWSAVNNTLLTLISSNLSYPYVVAADGMGNIYISDYGNNAIKELPYAFVDATQKLEPLAAGNDSLPPVLPVTENLLPPFAPTSDQSWLTISRITNGVVSFSFSANTGPARTAHITLLGQSIPVTQGVIGTPPTLTGELLLSTGILQFSFTNSPSGAFTVVSTTNLSLPLSNWTVLGHPVESPPGIYEFTSQPTTDVPQIFYSVISP